MAVAAVKSYGTLAKVLQGRLFTNLWRQNCMSNGRSGHVNVIRQMSHKRTMNLTPSNFEWRKFKDHMHFYITLGIVPVVAVVGYCNLFIGSAELVDIPDGYEPKPWEYHKHPISRFIARYLIDPPEKLYERHMHFLNVEYEKIQMRKLEQKVKLLAGGQGQHYDSKLWYYVPVNDHPAIAGRAIHEEEEQLAGHR